MSKNFETNILKYLSVSVSLLKKCIESFGVQSESLKNENIDNFAKQVEQSRSMAEDALVYKKTADALMRDMIKQNSALTGAGSSLELAHTGNNISHNVKTDAKKLQNEIDLLAQDYLKCFEKIKSAAKNILLKYEEKILNLSRISDITGEKNKNSYSNHLSEMLDISI